MDRDISLIMGKKFLHYSYHLTIDVMCDIDCKIKTCIHAHLKQNWITMYTDTYIVTRTN